MCSSNGNFQAAHQNAVMRHKAGLPAAAEARRLNDASLFPCREPQNPEMGDLAARFRTYGPEWPNRIQATPWQLAEAGLFYLNDSDRVKCYYCDGGLQNWIRYDDPWFEHAKWYPDCEYVLLCKGMDYVRSVAGQFQNVERPYDFKHYPNRNGFDSPEANPTYNLTTPQSTDAGIIETPTQEIANAVENLGFGRETIAQVLKERLEEGKPPFRSAEELLDEVQRFESRQMPRMQTESEWPSESNGRDLRSSSCCTSSCQNNSSNFPDSQSQVGHFPGTRSSLRHSGSMNEVQMAKRIEDIRRENRCKICLDKDSDCVLLKCGHVCCCADCGYALRSCPICRSKIDKLFKFYR